MKYIYTLLLLGSLAFVAPNTRPSSRNSSFVSAQDTVTVLMCTGSSAYTYHNRVCDGLLKCKADQVRVKLTEARDLGRNACRFCFKY